jgi:hypothetical protein
MTTRLAALLLATMIVLFVVTFWLGIMTGSVFCSFGFADEFWITRNQIR